MIVHVEPETETGEENTGPHTATGLLGILRRRPVKLHAKRLPRNPETATPTPIADPLQMILVDRYVWL
jgi:hypothetical protein